MSLSYAPYLFYCLFACETNFLGFEVDLLLYKSLEQDNW
jgi:hypothetical protein